MSEAVAAPAAAPAPRAVVESNVQSPLSRGFWLGAVDLRPLGIIRILLALLTLWDLFRRAEEFIAWHTDAGVLPRMALVEGIARAWRLSLLDMMGTPGMVGTFFVVTAIAAVGLLVGFKTRLCNFIVWAAVISLQERNLGVTDSSDTLYRVMLFWMMFAPAGAAYSLDRVLAQRAGRAGDFSWPPRGSAVALRMMQLEMVILYFVTSITKSGDHWRDGSSVYRAMQVWDFARPPADFFIEYLSFLARPMAYGTLVLEFSIACLLIFPHLGVRKFIITAGTLFHLGIEAHMNVGMFSLMMPIMYTLFLWDSACTWVDRRFESFKDLTQRVVALAERVGAQNVSDPHLPDWVGKPINRRVLAVLSVVMGTIAWDQVHEVNNKVPRPPEPLVAVMESLSLWQNWRMFAPNPVFDSGPWVAPGVLQDGTPYDALQGAPGFAHPPPYRLIYSRWNKFRLHVRTPEQRGYLLWLGRYLCRQANNGRRPGAMLDYFELIYQLQRTHAPWEPKAPVEPTSMWKHYCIKVPDKK